MREQELNLDLGTPTAAQSSAERTDPVKTLKEKAQTEVSKRRAEAEQLKSEGKTLSEIVTNFGNNYQALEDYYHAKTGVELVADPIEASRYEVKIEKKCSVVIPAYNDPVALKNTLLAVQASSFNAKYPQQLEVVVVDDGSPTNLAAEVEKMGIEDLNVKVFRESNGRENKARYSGVLAATGDIVLFTAHDVVYSPTMIEEYMKRHEVLDGITCFGFRDQVEKNSPFLTPDAIAAGSLWDLPHRFSEDGRVALEGMVDSAWLKNAGNNKYLPIDVNSGDWSWTLQSVAWGLTVSATREDLLRTRASYDERYKGFGGDDEQMIADLIADGLFVIPMTGGIVHHQTHTTRYKEDEAALNQEIMKENFNKPPLRQDTKQPALTDAKLIMEIKNSRTSAKEQKGFQHDPIVEGKTLLEMGLYSKAVEFYQKAEDILERQPSVLRDYAEALVNVGGVTNVSKAIEVLGKTESDKADIELVRALAFGRAGLYRECLTSYWKALRADEESPAKDILGDLTLEQYSRLHEQGRNYLLRGKPRQALRSYEGAITVAQDPNIFKWSLFDKGVALAELAQYSDAIDTLGRVREIMPNETWVDSRIGMVFEKWGRLSDSRGYYKAALDKDAENKEAKEGLDRVMHRLDEASPINELNNYPELAQYFQTKHAELVAALLTTSDEVRKNSGLVSEELARKLLDVGYEPAILMIFGEREETGHRRSLTPKAFNNHSWRSYVVCALDGFIFDPMVGKLVPQEEYLAETFTSQAEYLYLVRPDEAKSILENS